MDLCENFHMLRIKRVSTAPSAGEYLGELYQKRGVLGLLLTRRHPDLNRGKKDLQSSALPLGHVAKKKDDNITPFWFEGIAEFVFFYLHLESCLP